MPYLEKKIILQTFLEDLHRNILMPNGWVKFCTYQVCGESRFDSASGAEFRRCVRVMLVKSIGSDNMVRNLGFAYGYDGMTGGWETMRIVEKDGPLGYVGDGDGSKRIFNIKAFPVKPGALIYKNDLPVPDDNYELDHASGRVVFETAPEDGDKISAYYILDDDAPFPPKHIFVFNFDAIFGELSIESSTVPGSPGYLGEGDGTEKEFKIPNYPLKDGTTKIYIDDEEMFDFEVDIGTGDVIFDAAPGNGKIISYDTTVMVTNDGYCDAGDIETDSANMSADVYNSEKAMAIALNALQYVYPSPPSTISFIENGSIDNLWQFDSYAHCWGNINRDRGMLFFRFDPTPDPENTIFSPLYFGRLNLLGDSPMKNNVLLAGGRTNEVISYKRNGKIGNYNMDYGPHTSNGNHSVSLQRAIGGSRFQAHYLAFITHSQYIDNGEGELAGEYIDGKRLLMPIYIDHPNDGPVGKLDDVFAIHPKNIAQMEEFEVEETIPEDRPERIGVGDGVTDIFYLDFVPVTESLTVEVGCIETSDYVIVPELKRIKFNTPPGAGETITVAYTYHQTYKVVVPTAPVCPATLEEVCPYVPIGLAVLKENI